MGWITSRLFDNWPLGAWAAAVIVVFCVVLAVWIEYGTGEAITQTVEREKIEREERIREQVRRDLADEEDWR